MNKLIFQTEYKQIWWTQNTPMRKLNNQLEMFPANME